MLIFRTVARSLSALLLAGTVALPACAPPVHADNANSHDILGYIRTGWDGLTRSTTECSSLVDPKVRNTPPLYLPFGMATPPAVEQLTRKCGVQIKHLPRLISNIGDVRPAELPAEGLLYLPDPYVVPGGRFNEMYGWDSYFILLGLLDNNRDDLARGMVENFFFEIDHYGALLNANRTYFLTRSQPPLLSSMIRELYEHPNKAPLDKVWLAHAYAMAVRDHALWTSSIHRAGDTGLARYHDLGVGPVPEMADDSEYYPDVLKWLLAHPDADHNYTLPAPDHPTPAQIAELAKTSCDIRISHVCERAFVQGHRLTAAFYQGDRAMRESGFDTTFRFGAFSGSTENYAPVCLNSLLYKYETDLAYFARLLGNRADAARWNAAADARRLAMQHFLWDPARGFFYDWDLAAGKQSTYEDLPGFYPLWAGLATPAQAAVMVKHLPVFEHEGGLAMSNFVSGTQWDLPYGWAPTNWLTVAGLERYGFHSDAARIAREFSSTVRDNFDRDGTLREKYNVVSGTANIAVAAGYKTNVIGFGWTNGVYLRLHDLLDSAPAPPSPNAQGIR